MILGHCHFSIQGSITTHSTGLAIRQPFIIKVDCSPVNSGVRPLSFPHEPDISREYLLTNLIGAVVAGLFVGMFSVHTRESGDYDTEIASRYVLYAIGCYSLATLLVHVLLSKTERNVLELLLAAVLGSALYFFIINVSDDIMYDFVARVLGNTVIDTIVSFSVMLLAYYFARFARRFA